MSSLTFPDANVWFALVMEDHVHHASAMKWWNEDDSDVIAFSRLTQLSLLRLLTTSAVMRGKPLTMKESWQTYDNLFVDDRVSLLPEPHSIEAQFRKSTVLPSASPKLWIDAYLMAFATQTGGTLITFDRALENRGVDCLVLR